MKRIIFLFLLTCCSSDAVVEELNPVQTTEVVVDTTTDLPDTDLMVDNFHEWWKENKLKTNTLQTTEESKITQEVLNQFVIDNRGSDSEPNYFYPFNDNPFSTVVIYKQPGTEFKEFVVCTKQRGASGLAIIDENHPLQSSSNLPYVVPSSYVCEDEEVDFLWGHPFLQDGQWWIFKTIPKSERIVTEDCQDPCGYTYTHWATRTEFQPIRGTFYDDNGQQITFLPDFSDKYENMTFEVDYEYQK